jgi:hypothetical protein
MKCPIDKKDYSKQYYQKNKEKIKNNRLMYIEKYRAKARELQSAYRHKWRWEIINILGNKCAKCGYDNLGALQIDHINGKGKYHVRTFNGNRYSYYKHIYEDIKMGSKDYQILCANCNWLKRFERQEYRKVV